MEEEDRWKMRRRRDDDENDERGGEQNTAVDMMSFVRA